MVQRRLENRPSPQSDSPYQSLLFELQLARAVWLTRRAVVNLRPRSAMISPSPPSSPSRRVTPTRCETNCWIARSSTTWQKPRPWSGVGERNTVRSDRTAL